MYQRILTLFISLYLLISVPLLAEDFYSGNHSADSADSLRVGLVLSGGGAKGIAHIGVIKRLEEAGIRVDYVTGTSMGSLVGALYSIGYTSTQLVDLAKSSNWSQLFTEKPSRLFISNYERTFDNRTIASFPISERGLDLPVGIISGQNIYSFLSKYTWPVHGTQSFKDFPIPFATVATELSTGEPKTFTSGYLPDAIRASISIPSLMRPHKINGTAYIDGGVSNNLPVEQAIDMGAEFIIAVNVASPVMPTDSLKTFAEVLNQVVNYRINEKIEPQIEKSDLYINPERTNSFDILDFDKVDELIQVGYDEAGKYIEQINRIAEQQSTGSPLRRGVGEFGSLPLNQVIIEGNELISDDFILSELQLSQGFLLTPDFIENKISQLYSTQLFELITYRILPDEDYYYNLHIHVVENNTDVFRVGLRYESQTNASILLASEFRNFPFKGTSSRFDLRLGNEIRAQADLLLYGSLGSRIGLLTSALFESENVEQFENNERNARFKNNLTRLELSVGNYLSSNFLVAGGVRGDFIFKNNIINEELITISSDNHQSYFLQIVNDQFYRKNFPSRGSRVFLNGNYSGEFSLSPIEYVAFGGLFEYYLPLSPGVSFRNLFYSGYTSGNELPWTSWFSLNRLDPDYGYVRFGGIQRYELNTRNLQMLSAGFQFEPLYHRFINIDYYAGRFLNEWSISTDNIVHGASLGIGALTILGPVELIVSSSTENNFLAELQIGYKF
ncbi:patatin-like phospholipase family protein [Rhodohalobacter sp. 8-1]|uniref:patatin-like phospholipase family protein n=1 Tax=Rhodohalobacter sp. 8-1 TaxID=3131972 RepID=UPI0030EE0039